ncbi:MAG: hypothetical protein AAF791_10875, partial [Bacteroidota bacterium]
MADGPERLTPFLAEVRRTYALHRGIKADCAASLAMNEIAVLLTLDRFDEAREALSDYEAVYEGQVSPNEWVDYHFNRGYLLTYAGETQASTEAYISAAALSQDLPPFRAVTAQLYAALTFGSMSDQPRALAYLRLADSTARANQDSARVPQMMGEVRLQQALVLQQTATESDASDSLHTEAARTAQEALALLSGDDFQSPDRAMAQIVVAKSMLELGDLGAARVALDDARPLVAEARDYTRYVEVEQLLVEGELAEAQGTPDAARATYEQAYVVARDEVLTGRALDLLLALGRLAEETEADDAAEARYREAIALSETIRQRQGLQDWSLSASEQTSRPYIRLAALLARQGQPDEAFQMLDATRARHLFDLRSSLRARRALSDAERIRADSLIAALDGVRLALPTAQAGDRASLDAEATRLQRELAQVTGLALEPRPPLDLGALADTLATRQQVLVSYLLGEKASWAFLVQGDGLEARELPVTRGEIRETVSGISAMWQTERPEATDLSFDLAALEALYDLLVAPIRDAIPEGASLVTVPPTDLATVPFGMLVEPGGPTEDYAAARYLVRSHPVSTELAAALLLEPDTDRGGNDHLVFGRSAFDDRIDLPFVRDEARRVQRTLPSPLLRLDADATEAAL